MTDDSFNIVFILILALTIYVSNRTQDTSLMQKLRSYRSYSLLAIGVLLFLALALHHYFSFLPQGQVVFVWPVILILLGFFYLKTDKLKR
ncbi:hypothetical protein [Oenococcus kitaharae]|uniref:Uncharacterized protein n=1 Tax=Oenococcus kitaharae DSM 17330 TaxID=1045004 RepID=G9WF89_9LACO|nr:hypothetical protein [Oenococcus kitaharae]EHN58809.1 hypothetical protein OKIT_0698 [Oenococcus kitaharae DSM 17330]OEY81851.1 hypothetical protein NT96_08840 [Oenococcus kitaharae]OEY84080.1 hypothetical protein NT95_02900 [Oenococcus kitaharae]OEY85560.1 hypothetical protein NV75_03535 [Oenococcus kitaharae]